MPALRPVHWRDLVRFFERHGWTASGQEGSHIKMKKKGFWRPVMIPRHGRRPDVPVFIVNRLLKTAKLDASGLFEFLGMK
jgi:predicted RNA binding protein YcfA (HicA-like mRNA interferase family)